VVEILNFYFAQDIHYGVRVVTFMGNATYIKEIFVKNKLSDVYIDTSYVYNLQGKTFQFLSTSDIKALKNELTLHGINVVMYDTGVQYNGEQFEMRNSRLRIAKMIYKIANDIDDNILFVDSDVILNDDVFNKLTSNVPTAICIPALMKPTTSVIFDLCYSTNMYIPYVYLDKLKDIVRRYIDYNIYIMHPVDLYIHNALGTRRTIYVKGVCHYINGMLYCL
jgi:hypothetical protein